VYRILIFAKAPVPGQVKTRLAPLLGFDGAAALAREMLEQTCREAQAVPSAEVELCTLPDPADASWAGMLPDSLAATDQGPGTLGDRLARAARRATDHGVRPVLIGTDCPALDRHRLGAACRALEATDAFMHPTDDGGYALLALRRFSPRLFSGIAWSGPEVASRTISRLDELGWRYTVGERLRDIDVPADYEALVSSASASDIPSD
jgi:rSAM/selenodomain-associated transferase 1